jgi:hypothetical protein
VPCGRSGAVEKYPSHLGGQGKYADGLVGGESRSENQYSLSPHRPVLMRNLRPRTARATTQHHSLLFPVRADSIPCSLRKVPCFSSSTGNPRTETGSRQTASTAN